MAGGKKYPRSRWLIMFTVFSGYIALGMMIVAYSPIAEILAEEFGATSGQLPGPDPYDECGSARRGLSCAVPASTECIGRSETRFGSGLIPAGRPGAVVRSSGVLR